MSSKKILGVKPTKNSKKFIFETEMSADELAYLMQAEFPNNHECIVSIKPTGLWKNKLFVTVRESYLDSDNLNTMATILNKKLEAEEENFDWRIECYPEGENLTRIIASSQAAHHAALACQQNKFICIAESCIKPENVTFIWNVKTGEKLWPRETEKLWCIHFKSSFAKCDHALMSTREYAKKLIAHLKAGNRYAHLVDLKKNKCFVADVDSIKVFNEKNEQVWPAKTATQVFVVKVYNAALGCENKYFIDDATAIKLRNSIMKSLDAREIARIEFDSTMGTHVECSAGDVISITREKAQLWPRENEHPWCVKTKDKTYDVPEKVAKAYLKHLKLYVLYGNGFSGDLQIADLLNSSSLCNVQYNAVISITDSDGKVVWQKKQHCTIELAHHTGVICVSHDTADAVIRQMKEYRRCVEERTPTAGCIRVCGENDDHVLHFNDIKLIYDENGNDMLKDVLKKPEDDKYGCVIGPEWKQPVKKSFIPKLISMLNDTNIRKTAILEVKDENNEIIWRKKSEDTSFKAPSLLSRIYE